MNKLNKSPFKAGLYIRVSSEEQAENPEGSIKNQEERLRDYIKLKNHDSPFVEIEQVFCDPGVSAKDMNRPALQRLLGQIRSGDINLVLVTELSRLTRSTKDFALLWEYMREHDCQFQSLRDNFDTTTPAGEMIIFTLANFAQFERKQLGERISNSFQARAKRGLWNGGVLPLGYELDKERPGHLKIVPNEAEIVIKIFNTFIKEETLSKTGKALNDAGVTLPRLMRHGGSVRHSHFTIENVYRILSNKVYIGVRSYKTKMGPQESKGMWEPIIDETLFNRVRTALKKNKSRRKPHSKIRYPYLLSGIMFCKTCGDRLAGKSAHGNGGKIAYYEHCWSTKTQSCLSKKVFTCEPKRILAKKIEPVVWEDMKRFITEPDHAKQIFKQAEALKQKTTHKSEAQKIRTKIASLQGQIEATTERVTELPKDIDAQVFYEQILKLQKAKKEFALKLQNINCDLTTNEPPLSFSDFEAFIVGLKTIVAKTTDPEVKTAICRKLIHRIEVSPRGVTIHYYVGENHYMTEFNNSDKGRIGAKSLEKPHHRSKNESLTPQTNSLGVVPRPASKPLAKYSKKNLFDGSNKLTNGRAPGLEPCKRVKMRMHFNVMHP